MRCCSISSSKMYLKREGAATSFCPLPLLTVLPTVGSLVTLALVMESAGLLVEPEPLVMVAGADTVVSVFLLVGMLVVSTCMVSNVFYSTPATTPRAVDAISRCGALQMATRIDRNLHEDVVGVVIEGVVCLMRRFRNYYLRSQDRASLQGRHSVRALSNSCRLHGQAATCCYTTIVLRQHTEADRWHRF